jgi:heptosyltransferase-1
MAAVRRELHDQHYELGIDFQGAVKSGIVTRFAKTTLGMEHPRETPASWFYDRRITTTGANVVEQYHSLAEAAAGQSLPVCAARFPDSNLPETSVLAKLQCSPDALALINPGAGWGAKQWPAERYGEVARVLATDGMIPLVNFGPGEEELVNQVVAASGSKAVAISCSIEELIALTRRARLFIGGDTGPLHLAAALQVPVVAIFGPTDPARNGPYKSKGIVLRDPASRTSLSHTSAPDPGLLRITADEVIAAARTLLKDTHA